MAVYTHVSSEDLNLFLKDYEIGKLIEYVGTVSYTHLTLPTNREV